MFSDLRAQLEIAIEKVLTIVRLDEDNSIVPTNEQEEIDEVREIFKQ